MKLFLDCEFTGLHQNTTLISIGLVAETGESFYAELVDFDTGQVNDWVQQNVIDNFLFGQSKDTGFTTSVDLPEVTMKGDRYLVRDFLGAWVFHLWNKHENSLRQIDIWGDVLSYYWVLFAQLWGGALEIPGFVYYIPFDLATLLKIKGVDPNVDRERFLEWLDSEQKHNALWDAKVIKACYEKAINL